MSGLAHFAFDAEDPLWQPARWRDWPSILIGGDLGPDNVASDNALLWEYKLNMIRFPDPSHAAWRSVQGSLRDVGLHGFWVLMVVTANVDCGPDNSDNWYHVHKQPLAWMYANHTPTTSPLYLAYFPDIVAKLTETNVDVKGGSPSAPCGTTWRRRMCQG